MEKITYADDEMVENRKKNAFFLSIVVCVLDKANKITHSYYTPHTVRIFIRVLLQ